MGMEDEWLYNELLHNLYSLSILLLWWNWVEKDALDMWHETGEEKQIYIEGFILNGKG
jgi:hypothetical protein